MMRRDVMRCNIARRDVGSLGCNAYHVHVVEGDDEERNLYPAEEAD